MTFSVRAEVVASWAANAGAVVHGVTSPETEVRPRGRVGLIAQLALGGSAFVGLWMLGVSVQLLELLRDPERAALAAEQQRVIERTELVAVVQLVVALVTGVVFVVWLWRAYRAAERLMGSKRFAIAWTVFGWVVPILSFVRPRQIVGEIWRASDHATPTTLRAASAVPRLVDAWWLLFVVAQLLNRLSQRSVQDIGGLRFVSQVSVLSSITFVVAAVLAILVVRRLDARLAGVEHQPLTGVFSSRREASAIGAGLLGALGVTAAVSLGTLADAPAVAGEESRLESIENLHLGDCMRALPSSEAVLVVPLVDCGAAHRAEVVGVLSTSSAAFPGQAVLDADAAERCPDAFERYVDHPVRRSGAEIYFYTPTASSFAEGDRNITCIAGFASAATSSIRAAGTGVRSLLSPVFHVNDLEPGDCIRTLPNGRTETVPIVSCTSAHRVEAMGGITLADGAYAGDDETFEAAVEACLPIFEEYVGVAYAVSALEMVVLYPLADGWAAGDRGGTCLVEAPSATSAPLRDSRR